MVIEPMPDEFYERYRHESHAKLFEMLGAGSPEQVDQLQTAWSSMETTISAFSATLRSDLDRLREGWEGLAGREFDSRVGLVSSYGQTLASEYGAMHIGLLAMSSALAQALGQAEPPDATPPTAANSANNAMAAGSILGPVGTVLGGVVGGVMGHTKDEHAKEAAKERMALLAAGLAAEYRVAEFHIWPATVPQAPPNMPTALAAAPAPTGLDRNHDEDRRRDRDRDRDRHDDDDHHGGPGGHGPPHTQHPGPRPAQDPRADDPWGTSPAIIGAVGAGLATAGIVAATSDRDHDDRRGGHGHHGHHDGPTKVSLGDHPVMSDGVVRLGHGEGGHGPGGPIGSTGPIGSIGVVGPQTGIPGITGVPGVAEIQHTEVPAAATTGEGVIRDGAASTLAGAGGSEGGDGRGTGTPPPPTPPIAGAPPAAATATGAGTGTVTNPGTVGASGGAGSTYSSPAYGSHAAAAPGAGTGGPAGGEARSWMQEGRMAWRDHVEAPPSVLEEPTAE
jgi:uncharacterized protein YukE